MELTQSYTALPGTFYKHVLPTPVADPQLVIWNDTLAKELQFNEEPRSYTDLLAGNETGSLNPIAQAYAGHQFGNFTMLGDGRAILLGEKTTLEGKNLDIQLKGSGRTPSLEEETVVPLSALCYENTSLVKPCIIFAFRRRVV